MVRASLLLVCPLIALLALLAGPARATDDDVPRADDIVVRACTQQPAEVFQATPVETEVLTLEEVEALPARDVADIVKRLPGIRAQPRVQGQEAAVSIEGMPPEYTLLLVDGQIYSGELGGVGDLHDIPLTNIDRIEILRGAQALRYGSEAAGGVVSVITRLPPTDGFESRFQAGAGDQGFVQVQAVAGLGDEVIGGSLAYTQDQIDGFDAPSDTEAVLVGAGKDSDGVSRDGNAQLRWQPRDDVTAMTRFGYRREHEALRFEDDITTFRSDGRWRAEQTLEWLGDDSRAFGSLFYYRNELESSSGRSFELDEDEWKLDGVFDHFFETGPVSHAVSIGFDARLERIRLHESALRFDPDTGDSSSVPLTRERIQRGALYAIAESEVTRWLTFEAGVRGEFSSEFDPAAVPQIALLVTPFDSLKLRASWGVGHRAPSLRDLYQPPVPQLGGAYFLAGNPDLKTESSTSYRLGFEWTPDRRISLAGTWFYNSIDDHIRSTPDGVVPLGTVTLPPVPVDTGRPGLDLICGSTDFFFPECGESQTILITSQLYRKTNLDTVRTQGFETRLELRPHELVLGQLGYTFLETKVVDSTLIGLDELPNEAKHTVDALLQLDVPKLDASIALTGRWRSGALTETSGTGLIGFTSNRKSDDSFVLDLRVVQPLPYRLALFADVFNVTDERVVDSYVVRGRSFFVGLRGEIPWW